ncbi:HpcH/HpaI aldolase family protein [Salinarimonas soli]|uniref:HpcH/HpaI aldolase/citrate lyase family protein n=1 Tax=Salinarimonas soli TaxID=1638099 RepID=A0A5B2VG01_9HYPH|nr:HpcH/HpaI aldolase/citrate lyase family protein [Salinarimonas soli]KAA2238051.1 HpcH/HpaI aldolase/citrate lyase family protein [Salinarimonas soli]
MDLPRNAFKQALTERRPMAGTWMMSASPVIAEALGCSGFDFLVLDMEHTIVDVSVLFPLLQAVAGTPATSVVRLPWNDPVLVKRVLDSGAQSLMFPFVQNADEARAAVASTRYPPHGIRGVAAMHRASRFGAVKDYLHRAADELCVILQLETMQAVEALPDIAAVDGVDCLFVGPADLSASLGLIGQIGHPDVQKALQGAAEAAGRAGKPVGIVAPNPEMARRFLDYGYTWSAVSSDLAMVTGRGRELVGLMRDGGA